jgi:hypothetical protein
MDYETFNELKDVAEELYDALSLMMGNYYAATASSKLEREQAEEAIEAYHRWQEKRLEEHRAARRLMADDRRRGH